MGLPKLTQLNDEDLPPESPELETEPNPVLGSEAMERHPTRMPFPVSFGRSFMDNSVREIVRHAHRIRLPAKRWSALPSWQNLKAEEIRRILEDEGEPAFEDLRRDSDGKEARGPLLRRRHKAGGGVVVELTAEAEKCLKIRQGLSSGFRYSDPTGEEFFMRLLRIGGGYLEVGLSWHGMAGPWLEDWRRQFKKEAEKIAAHTRHALLFEDPDEESRERVDRLVRRARMLEDGRKIMEMILGQVGRQARNPVCIAAMVFKVLLRLEKDPHWKGQVEAGLNTLRACVFRVESFDTQKTRGDGAFLGEWWYRGAGPGDHGDGDYFLDVQPGFLGCLSVFERGKRKLASGHEVTTYDFGKKLTPEDKSTMGWHKKRVSEPVSTYSGFEAGRVFYNAAEGFSPERENLVDFVERELTVKKDDVSKSLGNYRVRKAERVGHAAPDANEPRLYNQDFCPLLPEGQSYQCALGHFRAKPETGRSLYGGTTGTSAIDGPRREGLLSVLGYCLAPAAPRAERRRVVWKALEDLKAVVVDYAHGVIAVRDGGGRWLTLEQAASLPENELGRRAKWYMFVPESWQEERERRWEARQEERASRGETPYAWKATETLTEAQRARHTVTEGGGRGDVIGLDSAPLHWRLRAARLRRKLSLAAVGEIFAVSPVMVYKWEHGYEPDEDGKVLGKPIAAELVPLILRWVDAQEVPTAEELAHRKLVRKGGNSATRKGPGNPLREAAILTSR